MKGSKRERKKRERERNVVCLTIHHHPSVLKAWLRSLVVEYVDEEERQNGSEGRWKEGVISRVKRKKRGGPLDESERKEIDREG